MVIDSHTEATVEAANRASSTSQCIATHAHLHLAILMGMLYWRSAGFPFTSTAARFLTQRLLLARACQTVRHIHTNTQLSPPLPLSHPPLYLLISLASLSLFLFFHSLSISQSIFRSLSGHMQFQHTCMQLRLLKMSESPARLPTGVKLGALPPFPSPGRESGECACTSMGPAMY